MALRLARLFGNSPEFWLNAQRAVDLWQAEQSLGEKVERIKPLRSHNNRVQPHNAALGAVAADVSDAPPCVVSTIRTPKVSHHG